MDGHTYIGARAPVALAESLELAARLNDRSVSAELRVAVERHCAGEASRRRAEAMTDEELDAELLGVAPEATNPGGRAGDVDAPTEQESELERT